MRICALLSFYDEEPHELRRLIASLPRAGVTHLVALDGKYETFSGEHDVSKPEAHEAIMDTCEQEGISLSLHVDGPWRTEMAKRTRLFDLASQHHADWLMVVDGDEEVGTTEGNPVAVLEATTLDVATVVLETPGGHTQDTAHRMYFRGGLGLTVVGNHYTYRDTQGRNLWGHGMRLQLEPAQPLRMLILHHPRDAGRRTRKLGYYIGRDLSGVETDMVA